MMHFDSSNINLIRAVGYYDSEINMLDGTTTTHGKLMREMEVMQDRRESKARRRIAAQFLIASQYPDDRILAGRYLDADRAERLSTFAALNDGTMKRDTLADLAATAGRWFLWGLAAATAAMMLSMAYDLALDLPGVIARAAQ